MRCRGACSHGNGGKCSLLIGKIALMPDPLPKITPVQYEILNSILLAEDGITSRQIREQGYSANPDNHLLPLRHRGLIEVREKDGIQNLYYLTDLGREAAARAGLPRKRVGITRAITEISGGDLDMLLVIAAIYVSPFTGQVPYIEHEIQLPKVLALLRRYGRLD